MPTIDHAAEADEAAAVGNYVVAQYHATRLLAEQQHTSNLIAYLALAVTEGADITDKGGLQRVADDIVQGLGGSRWIGRFRP